MVKEVMSNQLEFGSGVVERKEAMQNFFTREEMLEKYKAARCGGTNYQYSHDPKKKSREKFVNKFWVAFLVVTSGMWIIGIILWKLL